jgi:o-succinylbenzoate synthase
MVVSTVWIQVLPYAHRFWQPLQTRYGQWDVRKGLLLHLTDETGHQAWGEIAPLPWFGSESLEQAIAFCNRLGTVSRPEDLSAIPASLPACQFGFESALAALERSRATIPQQRAVAGLDADGPIEMEAQIEVWRYSHLLPAGAKAIAAWQPLWQQGYRTLKWKIGVEPLETEQDVLPRLMSALPAGATLRLDANGGLNLAQARAWLAACDRAQTQFSHVRLEYLEQPLPPTQLDDMVRLSQEFATAIALDESVATLADLQTCYAQGWRGIVVIKPAIAGSPRQVRQFCQERAIDVVCSTVFETPVGRRAALELAAAISSPSRALGYSESWGDYLDG